jgi:thymidylate synthase (FAD)
MAYMKDFPSAQLVSGTSLDLAIQAMNNCYGNTCTIKSLIGSIRAGHLSLLEHVTATFDILCSEAVLKQISRHRHLSPTVESSRGSDITDNGFYIHPFTEYKGKTFASFDEDYNTLYGEFTAQEYIRRLYDNILFQYHAMVNKGIPREVAAYILPMATMVRMRYTGNLRAWFEYLQKRLCKRASIEHRELAEKIYKELNLTYPDIFNKEMLGMCVNCKERGCSF